MKLTVAQWEDLEMMAMERQPLVAAKLSVAIFRARYAQAQGSWHFWQMPATDVLDVDLPEGVEVVAVYDRA